MTEVRRQRSERRTETWRMASVMASRRIHHGRQNGDRDDTNKCGMKSAARKAEHHRLGEHIRGATWMSDKTASKAARPASFINARRRGFLQGAAVAGSAAVAGPALAEADIVSPTALDSEITVPTGYRETDHIREYYAKARF